MITSFLGNLHPVLLHLPIGVFSIAFVVYYLHPDKTLRLSRQLNFILLIAWLSAMAGAGSGWLLGNSGDYPENTISTHQWTAITFTFLSGVVYFLHKYDLSNSRTHKFFQPILLAAMVAMILTGHAGGSLTHGKGFLWLEQEQSVGNSKETESLQKSTEDAALVGTGSIGNSLPAIPWPDTAKVNLLKNMGFLVKPIAAGSGWLEVSAVNMTTSVAAQLQQMASVATAVYSLNLSGHLLKEADLSIISQLVNLRRLDVRSTGVSDRFVETIAGLDKLEYLNLVGTALTDEGLKRLMPMKALKKVYCWNTDVTPDAVRFCSQQRPDMVIAVGY
ncbi:MAG: hypothetical protein RLZZ557_1452 [Bacteroidota bacterium]